MLLMVGIPAALLILIWSLATSGPSGPVSKVALIPAADAWKQKADAKSKLIATQADAVKLSGRVNGLTFTLPADQLVPRMVRDLEAIAAKSGIHLKEQKPIKPKAVAGGAGTRVSIEVKFRAPFQPGAVKFLYYAEEPSAHMVVDKVDITSADAHFKTVDVTAQISVYTRSAVGVSGPGSGENGDATQ
jgi:hypothetical protein